VLVGLLPPYLIRGRNDNDPLTPTLSHQGRGGIVEIATLLLAMTKRNLRSGKTGTATFLFLSFIPHLILTSIICRMRKEIRATEVAPTHAIDFLSLQNSRFRDKFGMTHFLRRNSYGYANERKILGEMERIF
jgi:hypothetical protein